MTQDKTVSKTITVKAPAYMVWEVLTRPQNMEQWLAESKLSVVFDLKIGSPITFSGKWHDNVYADKGTILEIDPPKVFKYNYWSCLSEMPDQPEHRSVIAFQLTPTADHTVLELTHSELNALAAYEHANFYWNVTLEIIKNLAEKRPVSGETVKHLLS